MSGLLTLRKHPDGTATLTLDVPGKSVNTLSPELLPALEAELAKANRDPEIRALVLASGKESGFVAGADLDLLTRVAGKPEAAAEAEAISRDANRVFKLL